MKCEELLRRLTEYSDGILCRDLCAEIERHLAECPACRELQQDLRDLARLCHECAQPRLPEQVRRRIESRLRG